MPREYFLNDPIHPKGGIRIKCNDDHDCVLWDYTNLIYSIGCEKEHDPWDRPCKDFKED